MSKFLIFIGKIALLLFLIALVLDIVYTSVFAQSDKRNKIEHVFNSESKSYDVVILGTSRANNHFASSVFEDKGFNVYNYGISGSHLFETSLILKLMLERNWKIKNIIIETDLNLSNEKRDEKTFSLFMPFLHQSEIISEHFKEEPDFYELYAVPFYRYIQFDSNIGFRAFYKTLIQEPTNTLNNKGYYPLSNSSKGSMEYNIEKLKPLRNRYLEEIKQLCEKNKINLISVATPICSNVKGVDYFKKVKALYPETKMYQHIVQGDEYFSSCGHLNDKGARLFTSSVLKDLKIL
ncbi:hypothetical protein NAT51_06195 [Flavobacterium amniphilum]|uniref:hypothetical protein n=1 Tax=Flavobacterium amniphilum TaxID=1834035 RepID=UPI00202A86CF|nr:hypothetical protein [Flavobacterium amniphilum]MCL9805100.1 hypothetical protein [Flavobacterium amniphilum]